jgi:hydroxyethylthiazole kinase-like uncharacterized protein yjeF
MTVQRHIRSLLPQRIPTAHKGQCGRVGILAGSDMMPGAALLATKAAFRSGAGLVYLAAPSSVLHIALSQIPEVIGIPITEDTLHNANILFEASQQYAWDSFIIGPGLGKHSDLTPYTTLIHRLYNEGICSVIDADALPLASHAFESPNMAILTPHEGEFSRLFGPIQDRTKAALAASISTQQTLVLKGKNTVIATHSGYSLNPTGNANMATAGSGDVLSGIIGGLWAQYPAEHRAAASWDVAALAVWLHGTAGDLASRQYQRGLMASDITNALGDAFRHIEEQTLTYTHVR